MDGVDGSLTVTLMKLVGLVVFGLLWMWVKNKLEKEKIKEARDETLKHRSDVQSQIVEENREINDQAKKDEKKLREDIEGD